MRTLRHVPLTISPSRYVTPIPQRGLESKTEGVDYRPTANMRLRRTILFVVIIALAMGTVFYLNRVNDPIYEGRRLSAWLMEAKSDEVFAGGPNLNVGLFHEGFDEPKVNLDEGTVVVLPHIKVTFSGVAQDAIHHEGTNALPLLVQMLGSKRTPLKRWIWEQVEAHPFLRRNLHQPPPNEDWKRQIGAMGAFLELSESASPATPQIKPLLKDPDCADAAIIALLAAKPQSRDDIASFTNVLCIRSVSVRTGPPGLIQAEGLWALASFGSQASGAIPGLLSCLTSTNDLVNASAAYALAKIGAPADRMVPLIVAHLAKTSSAVFAITGPQSCLDAQSVALDILALKQYGGVTCD